MIDRRTYTEENLERIREERSVNPPLLERAVCALGLLEALRKVGCPLIFKGGSSLMLLLPSPMRLSTDCDVLVEPGVEIDDYVRKAAEIYPFLSQEESVRKTNKPIVKRHFRFRYPSLLREGRSTEVLLDVVFAPSPYPVLVQRPIRNWFTINEGEDLMVPIPSVESLLGDKLTAFAPHTIGVMFHNEDFSIDKRLEVIKQFYDVSTLLPCAKDFTAICESYQAVAKEEIAYRGLALSPEDCLEDTFLSAFAILVRGASNRKEYAEEFLPGIRKIKDHIFGENFNAETAVFHAARVMLLSAGLLTGHDVLPGTIPAMSPVQDETFRFANYLCHPGRKEVFDEAAYAIDLFLRHRQGKGL